MTPAIKRKIIKAAELATEINIKGVDHVFFKISPHVTWVEADIYVGGWVGHYDPDLEFRVDYDVGGCCAGTELTVLNRLDEMISELEELI